MTNQDKPSPEGLMRLVSKYGAHRSAADANRNARNYAALDDAFARIEEYAERLASESAAEELPPAPVAQIEREALSDERTKFEAWARSRHLCTSMATDAWGQPLYAYSHIDALWSGWQARAILAASSDELAQAVRRYFECFDSPHLAHEFEQAERELRAAVKDR